MAHLASEEQAFPSGVTLELGQAFEEAGAWVPYRLTLISGRRSAVLEDPEDPEAGEAPIGRCVLGLAPRDELAILVERLEDLLAGRRKAIKFEPQEPNWVLEVSSAPEGWTATCWIDAGNQIADHYTWDALGIRFFTDTARLRAFLDALAAERSALAAAR